MPTEIPNIQPAPSFQHIQQQRQENLERVMAINGTNTTTTGGRRRLSRRKKRKRMYGGVITEMQPTGDLNSNATAAAALGAINQMDLVTAKQKIGGRSRKKKRRFRTRKYIKVNYVRNRK
jgi:hypothetical protein